MRELFFCIITKGNIKLLLNFVLIEQHDAPPFACTTLLLPVAIPGIKRTNKSVRLQRCQLQQ